MKTRSKSFFSAGLLLLLAVVAASAQFRGFQAANVAVPPPVKLAPGETVDVPLIVRIRKDYHINANKPSEEYLIPTELTWSAPGFDVVKTDYPEAELFVSKFSQEPLLVYSGEITITSELRAPAKLPAGLTELTGSLSYQACTDKSCLAPVSAEFNVPVR